MKQIIPPNQPEVKPQVEPSGLHSNNSVNYSSNNDDPRQVAQANLYYVALMVEEELKRRGFLQHAIALADLHYDVSSSVQTVGKHSPLQQHVTKFIERQGEVTAMTEQELIDFYSAVLDQARRHAHKNQSAKRQQETQPPKTEEKGKSFYIDVKVGGEFSDSEENNNTNVVQTEEKKPSLPYGELTPSVPFKEKVQQDIKPNSNEEDAIKIEDDGEECPLLSFEAGLKGLSDVSLSAIRLLMDGFNVEPNSKPTVVREVRILLPGEPSCFVHALDEVVNKAVKFVFVPTSDP